MNLRFLIIPAAFTFILASCHDATPPPYHDGNSVGAGDDSTPDDSGDNPSDGDNEGDEADVDLVDDTRRYVGPQVALDYGDGGVMFVERADAGYAFYDIDGNTRSSLEPGSLQSDGRTLRGTRVSVNGKNIVVSSSTVLKESDNRRWIRIVDVDGHIHLFVV